MAYYCVWCRSYPLRHWWRKTELKWGQRGRQMLAVVLRRKAQGTWLLVCRHLWSLAGLKPCLWAQETRALRSLMPTQEGDEGDNGRLKVTPSQRLPYPLFEVDLLSPSTCFQFPGLNIFGNDFVCLLASLLNHCLSPKVRVQHVLLTTKSSTHHTALETWGQPCVRAVWDILGTAMFLSYSL